MNTWLGLPQSLAEVWCGLLRLDGIRGEGDQERGKASISFLVTLPSNPLPTRGQSLSPLTLVSAARRRLTLRGPVSLRDPSAQCARQGSRSPRATLRGWYFGLKSPARAGRWSPKTVVVKVGGEAAPQDFGQLQASTPHQHV
jgi:hypothetical protein